MKQLRVDRMNNIKRVKMNNSINLLVLGATGQVGNTYLTGNIISQKPIDHENKPG